MITTIKSIIITKNFIRSLCKDDRAALMSNEKNKVFFIICK